MHFKGQERSLKCLPIYPVVPLLGCWQWTVLWNHRHSNLNIKIRTSLNTGAFFLSFFLLISLPLDSFFGLSGLWQLELLICAAL